MRRPSRLFSAHLAPEIGEAVAENGLGGNFKSQLQQVAQREFNQTPQYVTLGREEAPTTANASKSRR